MSMSVVIPPQRLLAAGVVIPPGATSFEIDARPYFISTGNDQHPVSLSLGDVLLCHGAALYRIPKSSPVSLVAVGDHVEYASANSVSPVLDDRLTDVFYVIRFMDASGAEMMLGKMSVLAYTYLVTLVRIEPGQRCLLENVDDFHAQWFGQISWHAHNPETMGQSRVIRPVFSDPYAVMPLNNILSRYVGSYMPIKQVALHYEKLIDFLTDATMAYAERAFPTILPVHLNEQGAVLPVGAVGKQEDVVQSVKSVRPFVKAAIQFAIIAKANEITERRFILIYNPVLCTNPAAAKTPLPLPPSMQFDTNFMVSLYHSGIPFSDKLVNSLLKGFRASLQIPSNSQRD